MKHVACLFIDAWEEFGDHEFPFAIWHAFATVAGEAKRFPFAWPGQKVAVMLENPARDVRTYNLAVSQGWAVLCFRRADLAANLIGNHLNPQDAHRKRRESIEMLVAMLRARRQQQSFLPSPSINQGG